MVTDYIHRVSKTLITLEFCANPEAVDKIIRDWLADNNFEDRSVKREISKFVNDKYRNFEFTVSIDAVVIYAYYGKKTSTSLNRMINDTGVNDAESYGIEIYNLLKKINNLSTQNGFIYNTFTFENTEYDFDGFEEIWRNKCNQKKLEASQTALDGCVISFMGAAALLFGMISIPKDMLDNNTTAYNLLADGLFILLGIGFLFLGFMMTMGFVRVALKTPVKTRAILAIIISILIILAILCTLIFTIFELVK